MLWLLATPLLLLLPAPVPAMAAPGSTFVLLLLLLPAAGLAWPNSDSSLMSVYTVVWWGSVSQC
jgi:hypothetical protein